MMTLRAPAALLLVLVTLAGCSSDRDWNGKDISGLMPQLAFKLEDTQGRPVTAEDSRGTIRVMFFGFTHCPDVCPTTMARLQTAVEAMPQPLQDDVTRLFVSVDPARDTPERLGRYVDYFGKDITGMTASEPRLRDLARRYRTTFGYGEPDESGNYDVSHSSAIYVFDREGDARLLFRSDLPPSAMSEDLTALARRTAD